MRRIKGTIIRCDRPNGPVVWEEYFSSDDGLIYHPPPTYRSRAIYTTPFLEAGAEIYV